MRRKILYLRWLNSPLMPEWSRAPNEDTGLSEIETVGYLILEDNQHIQVAQSNYEDRKYRAIQSIPKSVILERKCLTDAKVKETSLVTCSSFWEVSLCLEHGRFL